MFYQTNYLSFWLVMTDQTLSIIGGSTMRPDNHLLILLALTVHPWCLNAQKADDLSFPRVSIPETEVRYIQSAFVGGEFGISVAFPANYRASGKNYPVLYLTDANLSFAASTQIIRMMQFGNTLPQMLLVGIGYRTDSLSTCIRLRSRDLTPTQILNPTMAGLPTGGAPLFMRFIREELIPFIGKNYRVTPEATYAGVSYGGLFGLYVLFHEPETFQNYIIGSPSIWFDNMVTLRYEAEYAKNHHDLPAKVFMSAGELEESEGSGLRMVTNMKLLADTLLSRKYPNLRMETAVFPGETHLSAGGPAIIRGLAMIYRK